MSPIFSTPWGNYGKRVEGRIVTSIGSVTAEEQIESRYVPPGSPSVTFTCTVIGRTIYVLDLVNRSGTIIIFKLSRMLNHVVR